MKKSIKYEKKKKQYFCVIDVVIFAIVIIITIDIRQEVFIQAFRLQGMEKTERNNSFFFLNKFSPK